MGELWARGGVLFVLLAALLAGCAEPRAGLPTFQCADGSQELAQSAVDDDYCDCVDGSDEPHTSACSHITRELFECAKDVIGSGPRAGTTTRIPVSQVSDGICDCCDGSDEAIALRVTCPDSCGQFAQR